MNLNFIDNNDSKIIKNVWLFFFIIFTSNFLLKIIHLNYSSFWYDEIISVQSASLDFGHIKHVSEWDKNPPFYYYCLSVWTKLFSNSEYTVRLLSVIFSSLSAGFLFLIANKLFNKTTAIIASILFISNNVLYYYSHEARAYSLVLLLSLISTFIYFDLKEKPSIKHLILLGLFNFLIIYTHYIAGLVLLFQGVLALLYFEKKQKKHYLLSCLIVAGLVLLRFTKKQWLIILDFNSSNNTFWLSKSRFAYLLEVIHTFLFNPIVAFSAGVIIISTIVYILYKKQKQIHFQYTYSALIGVFTIVLLYLLGKVSSIFLDRYLIFAMPFLFILIGFGLSLIKIRLISIALIAIIGSYFLYKIDYKTDKKMDSKLAVDYIKDIKKSKDLIIVKTKDIKPLFCYYYDKNYFTEQKKDLPFSDNIVFCSAWSEIYDRQVTDYERIIVFDSYQEYNIENEKDFVVKLSALKKQESVLNTFKGIRISIYK